MSPDSSMRRALLLVLGVDGGDQGVILSQRPDFMAWISIHSSASAASSLGGHWCPPLNTLTRCVRRRLVSVLSRPGSSLKLKSRMPTVAKKTKGVSLLGRCAVARRKPAPQAVTPATSPGRPCAMLTATRSTGESGGVDLLLVRREARMSIGPHCAYGSKTRLPRTQDGQRSITRAKPRSALLSDHAHIILLSLDDIWNVESWTNSSGR